MHGLSRVYDTQAYEWDDDGWTGRQLAGSVIYELHVGTFTPEGTFAAAAGRLDHLVELGVDLVELLPVNAVNGARNWGYDGVGLVRGARAVRRAGRVQALRRRLPPARARRRARRRLQPPRPVRRLPAAVRAVLHRPARSTVGRRWSTWTGRAPDEVRRYIIDNALMWLRDYHVDGLRLDAVHALVDQRRDAPARAAGRRGRRAVDAPGPAARRSSPSPTSTTRGWSRSRDAGGYGLTAQWDDDVHHALHALLTGERQGYYVDFGSLADPGQGADRRVRARRVVVDVPRPAARAAGRTGDARRAGGSSPSCRTTTRSATARSATGSPRPLSAGLLAGRRRAAAAPRRSRRCCSWARSGARRRRGSSSPIHPEPELGRGGRGGSAARSSPTYGWDAEEVPDPQDPATFARSQARLVRA